MTFILISGQRRVGKTQTCNRLHNLIAQSPSYTVVGKTRARSGEARDFVAHYKKGEKDIVLFTPSDNDKCMTELAQYLDVFFAREKKYPEFLIAAIRETDRQKDQKSRMLALLYEVAQGTPSLAQHYASVIMQKPIHTPFALESLGSHAFVLRLERRPAIGTKEEQANALTAYCNGRADKAKKALDLAVARL